MIEAHERTRRLVGDEGLARLARSRVAVYGLGGVGGHALEALARAGVGRLFLVDSDLVEASNLNRQVLSTRGVLGRPKVEVARERVLSINPEAEVEAVRAVVPPDDASGSVPADLDHAVEAIDSVWSKAALLVALRERGVPTVCCLGAGGRLDPTAIRVADIGETAGCGLARRLRKRLHRSGVRDGIPCVWSVEPARPGPEGLESEPGTVAYLPGLVGLTAAGLVISRILGEPVAPGPASAGARGRSRRR